jgi:hypothetical protein
MKHQAGWFTAEINKKAVKVSILLGFLLVPSIQSGHLEFVTFLLILGDQQLIEKYEYLLLIFIRLNL